MNNEEKILELLTQMQGDITSMKGDITSIQGDITSMQGDITSIQGDITSIQADLTRVAVTQESVVLPQIRLLAEGHSVIQEQIRNISVIDRMEDDISTLKAAVKYLTSELEQLKQAM